ncbi:MAG: bifunctional phosphopantothenoylcysteine decarboxylase/phosphopantothenate--cysteine ligase CoaBC, partial [Proteobacteria bacterium]|nr:bifunctional phosphopantothenoylcysteine decarboxylase/phosphopantothenate--cysteine ligase CoaBC [Pseudomonadota bacterium]
MIKDKQVVLGITGGIAAYKAAEIVRQIVKGGGQVHVIMTRSAQEFIAPLTLHTLSGNPVTTELFQLYQEREIGHIALAQRAQILVIAPATANIIGKIAHGIADDILSTVVMATKAPVLMAPAMNEAMGENPIVQDNIRSLKKRGYHFIDPGWGDLACGAQGTGRMAEIEDIIDEMAALLTPRDFRGQKVLVTAGPTREMLDPVRFISNPSSGKMGFAVARALRQRGAQVTLISGPTALTPPRMVNVIPVQTAEEMRSAVQKHFAETDIVIKAAAVADYRPKKMSPEKIKKSAASLSLEMEKTRDILGELGMKKGQKLLIGFAAETRNVNAFALEKLQKKN